MQKIKILIIIASKVYHDHWLKVHKKIMHLQLTKHCIVYFFKKYIKDYFYLMILSVMHYGLKVTSLSMQEHMACFYISFNTTKKHPHNDGHACLHIQNWYEGIHSSEHAFFNIKISQI